MLHLILGFVSCLDIYAAYLRQINVAENIDFTEMSCTDS